MNQRIACRENSDWSCMSDRAITAIVLEDWISGTSRSIYGANPFVLPKLISSSLPCSSAITKYGGRKMSILFGGIDSRFMIGSLWVIQTPCLPFSRVSTTNVEFPRPISYPVAASGERVVPWGVLQLNDNHAPEDILLGDIRIPGHHHLRFQHLGTDRSVVQRREASVRMVR